MIALFINQRETISTLEDAAANPALNPQSNSLGLESVESRFLKVFEITFCSN